MDADFNHARCLVEGVEMGVFIRRTLSQMVTKHTHAVFNVEIGLKENNSNAIFYSLSH